MNLRISRKRLHPESRRQAAGDRLKIARERQGLSQQRAAELAGCNQSYWSTLENGTRNAALEWLYRVALEIGVDPHELDSRLYSVPPDASNPNPPK